MSSAMTNSQLLASLKLLASHWLVIIRHSFSTFQCKLSLPYWADGAPTTLSCIHSLVLLAPATARSTSVVEVWSASLVRSAKHSDRPLGSDAFRNLTDVSDWLMHAYGAWHIRITVFSTI